MEHLNLKINEINENIVTVLVDGYIDSNTANYFGDFIQKVFNDNLNKKVIIDFKNVRMITSACIRWLLTFEKKHYDFELTNVSREVFTVLKLTGVSAVLDINQEPFSICTDGCKVLGKGFSSEVFKLDDETIAKVYYNVPDIDVAIRERMIAKQAFVKGVPTEISFGMCESNGMPGLVYELVNAKTLISEIAENEENIDKYIKDYVSLVKEVHKFDNEGLTGIYDKKQDFIENAKYVSQFIPSYCYDAIIKLKDEIADNNHLLHGDPHPANVMLTDKGMIFIDLSDMGFGDEKFDLMFLYRTLVLFSLLPNNKYAIEPERCHKLWDRFAEEYYKDKDEEYTQKQLYEIKLLALNSIVNRFCLKNPDSLESQFLIKELIKAVDDGCYK